MICSRTRSRSRTGTRRRQIVNYMFFPDDADLIITGFLRAGQWLKGGEYETSMRVVNSFILRWQTAERAQMPSRGLAVHLTDEVRARVHDFITDRLLIAERAKLDRWIATSFQVAQTQAGLSLQTLSDHFMYLRNLRNIRNTHAMCITGYCEGSARFNHSHRPGFYDHDEFTQYTHVMRGHDRRRLNQIIMAAPSIDAPATVYRIANVHGRDLHWFADHINYRVRPWHDQLVSTSFSGFIENYEGIHFVISLPVGTCGLTLLDPQTIHYLDDYEFLLPVGTEFEIIRVDSQVDSQIVYLQLLGPLKPPTPSGNIVEFNTDEINDSFTYQDVKEYMLENFFTVRL